LIVVILRFSTSTLPIGVDIGGRQIKAVQFKGQPGRWRIRAAACAERQNPGAPLEQGDIAELRRLLDANSFKGRNVVLAVPCGDLFTGIMELPPRSSGAPVEQLARTELSRMHRCDADSFEMVCWDLPAPARAGGSTYVMAAGFSHEKADVLLDTVEAEGLDVHALDIHASAVARACGPLLEGVTAIAAILDLGWDKADLVLLYESVIVYERKLTKCGIDQLVAALGAELKLDAREADGLVRQVGLARACADVSPDICRAVNQAVATYCQALTDEMRIPLSYLANQYPDAPAETLLLIGGGGRIPGLQQHLDSILDFYVRAVSPSDIAQCPPAVEKQFGPSLALAAGLGQFAEK